MPERKKIVIGRSSASSPEPWSAKSFTGFTSNPVVMVGGALVLLVCGLFIGRLTTVPNARPADKEVALEIPLNSAMEELNASPVEYVRGGVVRKSMTPEELFISLNIDRKIRTSLARSDELKELDTLLSGHRYRLIYADSNQTRLNEFEYYLDESEIYRMVFRPVYGVEKVRIPVQTKQRVYAGVIAENIWLEILESDQLHHDLIPLVEAAVKWTVDVFHLSPGDRFKFVYTERIVGGKVVGIESLDAVEIRTLGEDARTYKLFRWGSEEDQYFNSDGYSVRSRYLKAPVKFAIISSPYSKARRHPVTGELKPHNGIDYAAPTGAPIFALADGIVEKALLEELNGKNVRLIHDERYKTQYLHMSDFAPEIRPGALVKQGQIIGYVGSTGQSTGPHVCLRFWDGNEQVDFLANRATDNVRVRPEEQDRFDRFRREMETLLDESRLTEM